MTFHYKLKYYKNEEGEFTETLPCDREYIHSLLSSYWGETLPNGLELIVVTNSIGQSIILEHSGKDVFEVYFLPLNKSFLFHKKSRIDLIEKSLDLFLDNRIEILEESLNKTKKENGFIRSDFIYKDFSYTVTPKRKWNALYPTVLTGLPLGLLYIVATIITLDKLPNSALFFVINVFALAMGFLLWLPGLILHRQYVRDNMNFIITITRGENAIRFDNGEIIKDLLKSDIICIRKVENPWYKMPWSDYGYTEIQFKSGEFLNLTNLIIDQLLIFDKFDSKETEITLKKSLIPMITNPTCLK
ncbi:MAG TPA: hypothetical protein VL443_21230 [Cyclobacteriaceae bacterium]|nr:hypothetical protein [Cyclobacteriaceae bacterium]